jgi:hypothetical protein
MIAGNSKTELTPYGVNIHARVSNLLPWKGYQENLPVTESIHRGYISYSLLLRSAFKRTHRLMI